jgi:hypothetical protein
MDYDAIRKAAEDYAAQLGLIYEATFVPFSKSRNAKPDPKPNDLQINWKIRLKRGGRSFECDYQEGILHLPKALYKQGDFMSMHRFAAVKKACETGRAVLPDDPSWMYPAKRPALLPPALADVLHCLVSDYRVLDYPTYEEWAREYGYEEDSRAGERTYRACQAVALQMRGVLSDAEIEKLDELLRDL